MFAVKAEVSEHGMLSAVQHHTATVFLEGRWCREEAGEELTLALIGSS